MTTLRQMCSKACLSTKSRVRPAIRPASRSLQFIPTERMMLPLTQVGCLAYHLPSHAPTHLLPVVPASIRVLEPALHAISSRREPPIKARWSRSLGRSRTAPTLAHPSFRVKPPILRALPQLCSLFRKKSRGKKENSVLLRFLAIRCRVLTLVPETVQALGKRHRCLHELTSCKWTCPATLSRNPLRQQHCRN